MTPLLSVEELSVHFPILKGVLFTRPVGVVRAVNRISFSLNKGETLGLVGESGCGKSSTARAIVRLIPAIAGKVHWEGQDILSLSSAELLPIRQHIQMIFQDPYSSLDPRMTVGSIIAEPLTIFRKRGVLSLSKNEIQEKVEFLMDRVGLSKQMSNRYPHEFSGGQRQRIGIARSLALNPALILADEPVSALDVSIQAQIINLLRDLQGEFNLTYLIIAHDLAVIRYCSNRTAVMYLGNIVEEASSEKLFTSPLHPYTQALLSAIPIPDPVQERTRKRIILTGEVPSPDIQPEGCVFYDRCPLRMPKCKTASPRLVEDGDHRVACFLHSDKTESAA